MNKNELTVSHITSAIRIDKYMADHIESMTRSNIQKLIKQELVYLNGKKIDSVSIRVKEDDIISYEVPAPIEVRIEAEDIPLDILYEDQDLLVVNKAKGMVVHPSVGHYTGTLVNGIMFHCKGQLSGINGEIRPGIVHRIDMNTTGSLIVCKNDQAHQSIAEQLKVHSVKRLYRGLVLGNVKEDEGTIDKPIGRSKKDRMKMAIAIGTGKSAVTHYRVLERFGDLTYMEFQLETGRTHQIRIHLASIHHPIYGDDTYGKPVKNIQGQTLHAGVIGFIHPRTGEYMEFNAPLPQYFNDLLEKLRRRNERSYQ